MLEWTAYSSLQADSKVNIAVWLTSSRPSGTDRLVGLYSEDPK